MRKSKTLTPPAGAVCRYCGKPLSGGPLIYSKPKKGPIVWVHADCVERRGSHDTVGEGR